MLFMDRIIAKPTSQGRSLYNVASEREARKSAELRAQSIFFEEHS